MGDWRSYAEIAERYDRVWSARFQAVARHIWALMPPRAGDRKLDIGTGTGIVPRALAEVAQAPGLMVGCDRSAGMLLQARAQVAGLRVLVGDATALPFESENFDLATASFVLSHVRDYHRALEETLRVLKPSGILAVTNWAPASDPHIAAWSDCLAETISKPEAQRASAEVAPMGGPLLEAGSPGSSAGSRRLLPPTLGCRRCRVRLDCRSVSRRSRAQFGRTAGFASSGGRRLGAFPCSFQGGVSRRFGSSFRYRRDALVVIARKPPTTPVRSGVHARRRRH